jgi:hypothetical protein
MKPSSTIGPNQALTAARSTSLTGSLTVPSAKISIVTITGMGELAAFGVFVLLVLGLATADQPRIMLSIFGVVILIAILSVLPKLCRQWRDEARAARRLAAAMAAAVIEERQRQYVRDVALIYSANARRGGRC